MTFKKDPEKVKQYNKLYYSKNREREKLRVKIDYEKNREKRLETAKKYRKSHKTSILEKLKSWRDKNRKHIREYNKQYKGKYYPENIEKVREYLRENSGKINSRNSKRYAIKRSRYLPCSNLEKIKEIYMEAQRLTQETGTPYEVDHIVPLQGKYVSGFHVEWNLQILTSSENRKKNNYYPISREFIQCS